MALLVPRFCCSWFVLIDRTKNRRSSFIFGVVAANASGKSEGVPVIFGAVKITHSALAGITICRIMHVLLSELEFFFCRFRAVFKFPRDEAHLSVRCFLVVPDRARLSRLCRRWSRQCSRCVPAGSAVFAILQKTTAALLTRSPRWYRLVFTAILVWVAIIKHRPSGGQSVIWLLTPERVVVTPNPP